MTARATSFVSRSALRVGDATAWLFFATFAVSVFEVVARYAFGSHTSWAHVLSTALCVAGFAVGGSYAMAQDAHLRVTVLSDRLRGRWHAAATWLTLVCGAVYLAGLGWGLWRELSQSLLRFDGIGGAWNPERTPGPPHWPLPAFAKAVLFAGALLFLLAVLDAAWRRLRQPRARTHAGGSERPRP